MGNIWIREFKGGLDTRRLPETTPGGALIFAQDCHITQGGEIEQRADFVPIWTAPPGECVGLAADDQKLHVFGHAPDAPAGLPANFVYKRLQHPTGQQLQRVPAWAPFGNVLATVGAFGPTPATSERYLFNDTSRVTDSMAPPNVAASEQPFAVEVHVAKLFAGAGTHLYFSKLRDASDFHTTASGAGFIDMAFEIGAAAKVRAIAVYEDYLAVFFPRAVMIWSFDADPDASAQIQTLKGFGTFSSRTVLPYRGGDVIFYDPTGIRSLRARDSTKSAYTADLGSAIDTLTQAAYAATPADRLEMASMAIEPRTGRVWIAIEDQIFVLSQYDVTKVTAWTVYKPGFVVDYMVAFNDRLYLRSGEQFYVYGSETGPHQYSDDVHAEAWLPYLDGGTPAQAKQLSGVDVACRGTWEIRVGYDAENLDATDLLARVGGTTFGHERIPIDQGEGTHIGLRFRSRSPAAADKPAIVSSAVIHHNLDDQGDS